MRRSPSVVLASLNRHKLEEFQELFAAFPEVEIARAEDHVRNAEKLGHVETFNTYAENAAAKARLVSTSCHHASLADDSGLEVEALGWGPGVRSHRYAIPKAGVSQDEANREKLLTELRGRPMSARNARFVCSLALVVEGVLLTGHGVLEGLIAEAPQGTGGFGYDPLFIPKGQNRTLAQMAPSEKNAISHRALAVQDLMRKVKAQGIVLVKV